MLTQDLSVTLPQLDLTRTAARLRDPGDCEPTRYELYIMASYMREGMRVEKTDTDSTGEFRVFEGGQCVHVECKYKTLDSLKCSTSPMSTSGRLWPTRVVLSSSRFLAEQTLRTTICQDWSTALPER
jgi:hypothetical protein